MKARSQVPPCPFQPLPPLDDLTRQQLGAVAEAAYDRYLMAFLEEHSLCPFARGGRRRGMTTRVAYVAQSSDAQPLIDIALAAAPDAAKAVVALILPAIDVEPEAWRLFAVGITNAVNAVHAGGPVYSVAALHPDHPYSAQSPLALVPLFRRAPDPTMQLVRLDALEAVYEGRSGKDVYVPPELIPEVLSRPAPPSMFDRIAETNMKMAQRLGIGRLERDLRVIHEETRRNYQRLLLHGDPAAACPQSPTETEVVPQAATTRGPILEKGGGVGLAAVGELPLATPVLVNVDGLDVVLVRTKDRVHVLYGRCPHRLAPLDTAIVEQGRLMCSRHGWSFRLEDGHAEGMADESLHRFQAWEEDGLVFVEKSEVDRCRALARPSFNREDLIQ
jgi:nitrite reductase/ring-hydroxylating ferredoxin subunit